ncbi:hypothetical protein AAY473_025001 [Plecturocebus cupreus]
MMGEQHLWWRKPKRYAVQGWRLRGDVMKPGSSFLNGSCGTNQQLLRHGSQKCLALTSRLTCSGVNMANRSLDLLVSRDPLIKHRDTARDISERGCDLLNIHRKARFKCRCVWPQNTFPTYPCCLPNALPSYEKTVRRHTVSAPGCQGKDKVPRGMAHGI